jgi:ribosomal-protein-alanine N-acetyltransferase
VFSPTQWNKGYATEVCLHLMKLLRKQHGVYRIQSFVDAENVSSARVLIKSGLIEEAKLARWFRFVNQNNEAKDCILFKLPLDEHKDLPA